ncbi:Exported protein [Candidatus Nitrospira nitrificans]|uniref:Exported protein n=1 Tax=Candidatus Nitrospira nitrificans TaxID=1742973 RepID=A0A0S4L7R6_9BACT|nr:Exported protein [Candidatus Nitrospira nitrificans]
MDRRGVTKGPLWLLTLLLVLGSGLVSAESPQTERNNGLTVEDLAQGVRSAARNIEKEIPKIGPAIGKTVTSLTGNSSETKPTRPHTAPKK